MRDFSKNYARWISGLTKDQFDEFIKVFIKEYWNVDLVSISDGTNDGGLDIKIFLNKINKKIPIQITVEKTAYKKIQKDLAKIAKWITDYNYSETFYFYYSSGASETKVIELEDFARQEYGIDLKIFDNKLISSYLDKPEYFLSREKLNEILGLVYEPTTEYFNESDKLYFDLMSYSPDTLELKEKFIYSFVLNELSLYPQEGINKKNLTLKLEEQFNTQLSDAYCNKLLDKLLTEKKIELTDATKNVVRLSEKELMV